MSYVELRSERDGEMNATRYEPFEISPETIEQELQHVEREQRQTDLRMIII